MIDVAFIDRFRRAVEKLAVTTRVPQMLADLPFEVRGSRKTWEKVWGDPLPSSRLNRFACGVSTLFGFPIVCDESVPPDVVWVVEPRSQKYVTVKVS